MTIAATEFCAALAAFVLLLAIVAAAGAAVADRLRFPGFAEGARLERAGLALVCGFGCLPVALDLAGRLGPRAMALAALSLAALGAPALLRARPSSLQGGWIAAASIWIVASILIVIDMPGVGSLQHSLLAVDYVKHAATTWSLAEAGSPPWNPTYYDPGRAMSYYYLFYTLPAVAAMLGGPLGIAARHAAYACAPLMGFALFALACTALRRSGADAAAGQNDAGEERKPANWPLLALLLATGLDIVPLTILYFGGGRDADFVFLHFVDWDEQVTSWFNSVMWVPHHVSALCAALVGFIALTAPGESWRDTRRRVLLAAVAFASMVGQSAYVAMPATLGAGFWLAALLWRRRFDIATQLCVAGLGALALAAPWLATLLPRFGGEGKSPLALRLRGPEWIDIVAESAQAGAFYRGLVMPMFYLIDFGVFALGAYIFWRSAGRRGLANELGMAIVCLAAASLLIGSLLCSQIVMNDLGWRVMLFAQFAALIWTAAAMRQGLLASGRLRYAASVGLAFGYAALVVATLQLRFFFPHAHMRDTLADQMAAWSWLDARLPSGAVVQPTPSRSREYGYGLYGRFPVAVADRHNALLFGARPAEIEERMDYLSPIFSETTLSLDDVRRRAGRFAIAALIVSSRDAVFAAPQAWTASARADYSNANFRIYLLNAPRHAESN
ncbi:hypothetical protein [Methylosinus sp. Sm6]|uniref:hypothetical protein n=1 Tax=Methylosinus sp. Sm6 TaxID=2866948 RepID=UPI001C98F89C|nr:hypothetical protein [Methylosinus sp. Sm6]MBY6239703.1 hypothetical protein [Methylosinus sp. Sm6]